MICYQLNKGFKQCYASHLGRWVQRVVLINKLDVDEVVIDNNLISFTLNASKRGFHYEYSDTFIQVLGNYEVVEKNNYKQFRHNIQMAISGLDFDTRFINNGEYFAALLDNKGRVYIFGFDYLLKPEDYLFESHKINSLTLRSGDIGLESTIPLRYVSENPKGDFMDDFANNTLVEVFGEFSNDFNDDFNN